MSTDIAVAASSASEDQLSQRLRLESLRTIQRLGMDDEQVAKLLGILPSGSMNLRIEERWPVALALRVADALNVRVVFVIGDDED